MITITIDRDVTISINDQAIEITRKKLRAIIAFFAVEKSTSRDELARIFFDGNKNNIRNSIYLINKQLGIELITNIDRHVLQLNTKYETEVIINDNFLDDLNIKKQEYIIWKTKYIKNEDYYIHNKLIHSLHFNIINNKDIHHLILGPSGIGKTEFVNNLYNLLTGHKIIMKCNLSERNFSLNIIYLILKYLSAYEKKDFLKIFNDITYNNIEAFKDENNLLNIYYLPIEQLVINTLENDINRDVTIILEDIEYIDISSLNIINKVINNNKSKITFVFTGNPSNNISLIKENDTIQKHYLNNWTKIQLQKYLTYEYPDYTDKIDVIFEATEGNPLLVNEHINNLQGNKSHDKFNKLEYLTTLEQNILNFCSCFTRYIPITAIKTVFLNAGKELENLQKYKLIYLRNVANIESVYFTHQALKSIVYEKLTDEQKSQYHTIIAEILEKERTKGNIIQVYEIYYHYSKTSLISKELEYKIKYLSIISSYKYSVFPLTNKFGYITNKDINNIDIAKEIENIDKLIQTNIILSTNTEFLIDYYTLKNRYDIIVGVKGDVKSSIEAHIECCKLIDDTDELIKSYYLMIYYALNFGNSKLIDAYLEKIYSIEQSNRAITKRIEGYNFALKNEFDKAIFVLNEAIELSASLPKEIAEANLVACYAYLGEIYIVTKDYKRALKDLERGKKIVDDSLHYISGALLITLFSAIANYYLNNNEIAYKLIKEVIRQYEDSKLCWKRSLCYMYAKLIYYKQQKSYQHFDEKIENCQIKYHNAIEKQLYYKIYKK